MDEIEIFVDGSTKCNNKSVIWRESKVSIVIPSVGCEYIRHSTAITNNECEWDALIEGLKEALIRGLSPVIIYSDSELVVRQFNGDYRIKKSELKSMFNRAKIVASNINGVSVRWISRSKNLAGITLENEYELD